MTENRIARGLLRAAALCAALAVASVAAVTVASPAHAATASFVKTSAWATGYAGQFLIHNDTNTTVTSWRVEFDLPPGTTVVNYWSVQPAIWGNNHYVFINAPWNGTLAPGASTTFGWIANGTGDPTGCLINGVSCTGGSADTEPPTAPTNLSGYGGVAMPFLLTWTASTDNVAVVRYDVYVNDVRVGSTTTTSFAPPVGPGITYRFRVVALDAAGNASQPAELVLTTPQMPTGTPPPAPPAL